ncbi:hypothetical protein EGY09_15265 [Stenotrophomonas maltophilia]|nr:hypothetical protein EGY09_15265 [Stenotrophomonas maltophilia]
MSRVIYSILDWVCDQIRGYEAAHGNKPDQILVTPEQAIGLLYAAWKGTSAASVDPVELVRQGGVFVLGVPLKLLEVGHGR